ncbi:MAG: hypothetical protein RLY31_1254 [Bacteroidota bacterium]|jgi:glycosyltransferase involved in cell wall biosynthesis
MKVSVVIPTFNRPESLHRCLEAFRKQTLPAGQWEVVVVNDGGSDIRTVVEPFRSDFSLTCLMQTNAGPASARNHGAKQARGQLLAFTDDDCTPRPDWLERIVATVNEHTLLGGKVLNHLRHDPYAEASQLLIDYLYRSFENTSDQFFTSNNLALRRVDFEALGGFDTTFPTSAGEDREFCVRARKKGLRLVFRENVRVCHHHRFDFAAFYRMHRKYGRAAFDYQQAVRNQSIPATRTPRLRFYLDMLAFVLRQPQYPFPRRLHYACLVAISQMAVAHGFFVRYRQG